MMNSRRKRLSKQQVGFSITELVVVVLIILIVAAMVIPNIVRSWYDSNLRASAYELSDLMQQARILAEKKNTTVTVRYRITNNVQQAYIDVNNDGAWQSTEPIIDLGRQFTMASAAPGGSSGNPSNYVLSGDTTSGTPCDNTCTLGFSARGLPCSFSSPSTCTTPAASYFVFYINDNETNKGWAAVVVTKAGRSNGLVWNGASWN